MTIVHLAPRRSMHGWTSVRSYSNLRWKIGGPLPYHELRGPSLNKKIMQRWRDFDKRWSNFLVRKAVRHRKTGRTPRNCLPDDQVRKFSLKIILGNPSFLTLTETKPFVWKSAPIVELAFAKFARIRVGGIGIVRSRSSWILVPINTKKNPHEILKENQYMFWHSTLVFPLLHSSILLYLRSIYWGSMKGQISHQLSIWLAHETGLS